MSKKFKIICIAFGGILFLSGMLIAYRHYVKKLTAANNSQVAQVFENKVSVKKLSKSEIAEDSKEMIGIIEATHPIFLEGVPEKYKEAKDRFLRETNKEMTEDDFKIALCKYLTSIEDGHTKVNWNEEKYLDVNWRYLKDKLTILDEKNKATDQIVTKINGVDIQKILAAIDEIFPAENYAAKNMNYALYSKSVKLLSYCGIDCSKNIELTIHSGSSERKLEIKLTDKEGFSSTAYETYSKKIDDKTLYVKLGICEFNNEVTIAKDSLKEVPSNGIKNVIIDVADNPGGNSMVCTELMEALNIKPGDFGSVTRFSPLAQKEHGYSKADGSEVSERNNAAVMNPNINLYVITNERTFSSAQWLATWVRDGKLGTIVGRPSANMPSSFGFILPFELKNSGFKGQISHVKWLRPDKSKDSERTLEPDIYVDYSENALDKTLELISSKRNNPC